MNIEERFEYYIHIKRQPNNVHISYDLHNFINFLRELKKIPLLNLYFKQLNITNNVIGSEHIYQLYTLWKKTF